MEKFQKIYQFSIMTDDKNVDQMLMMWKNVGEVNWSVEICGKGTVFALFLPDFSTECWNDVEKIVLLFFPLINSHHNVEK